jgi:hypothetical protein
MIIANPIFDVVFKRLMENERVAKFFISTILDEVVESVEVKPQEYTYVEALAGVSIYRVDFIATIRTADGGHKKVLIEIQKAKNTTDLMRFRGYLAEQYKKEDVIASQKVVLPITTIYILGFVLPEVPTACVHIARTYEDLINQTTLHVRNEFIEKLTHDSYVIQVTRITGRYQTHLDKLLSIFEQNYFLEDRRLTKDFNHFIDLDGVKTMTDILHHVSADPEERKNIEIEQEAWRTLNEWLGNREDKFINALSAISAIKTELAEKDKALAEKDSALAEKDSALAEMKNELGEKDKAFAEMQRLVDELMKKNQ